MFTVEIRDSAPMRLAVLRHLGVFEGIGAAFDRLMAWGGGRGLIGAETRFVGAVPR